MAVIERWRAMSLSYANFGLNPGLFNPEITTGEPLSYPPDSLNSTSNSFGGRKCVGKRLKSPCKYRIVNLRLRTTARVRPIPLHTDPSICPVF